MNWSEVLTYVCWGGLLIAIGGCLLRETLEDFDRRRHIRKCVERDMLWDVSIEPVPPDVQVRIDAWLIAFQVADLNASQVEGFAHDLEEIRSLPTARGWAA